MSLIIRSAPSSERSSPVEKRDPGSHHQLRGQLAWRRIVVQFLLSIRNHLEGFNYPNEMPGCCTNAGQAGSSGGVHRLARCHFNGA